MASKAEEKPLKKVDAESDFERFKKAVAKIAALPKKKPQHSEGKRPKQRPERKP